MFARYNQPDIFKNLKELCNCLTLLSETRLIVGFVTLNVPYVQRLRFYCQSLLNLSLTTFCYRLYNKLNSMYSNQRIIVYFINLT